MGEMVDKVQAHLRKSSGDIFLMLLKLLSGGALGLTFALIIQEALGIAEGESLLGLVFIVVVTTGVFLRVAKSWGLTFVLIFNLVCVLLGMVLRLYIMIAPEH